jgi:hypothetical protein
MNKKTGVLIISIVMILILSMIIGGIFYFFNAPIESAVASGEFTCPAGNTCTVTPILDCTNPSGSEPVVLARTDDTDYSNGWLVYRYNGELISYTTNGGNLYGHTFQWFTSKQNITLPSQPYNRNAFIENDGSIIYIVEKIATYNYPAYYMYTRNYGGNTNSHPLSSCVVLEICSGTTNKYSCSKEIKIDGNSKGFLTWEKEIPTPDTGIFGTEYSLTGGQKISFNGRISYTISTVQLTTCISSNGTVLNIGQKICRDNYALENCDNVNNKPTLTTTEIIPPQICRNGGIVDAYHVETTLSKLVLSKSDTLSIDFALKDTPTNKNIDITATILKNNQFVTSKIQKTGNTYLNAGKTSFTFSDLPIGYYTLRISFSHPDGDYQKEYNIQVTEDLAVVLTTADQIQFDSKDIEVNLNSFKSGQAKDLSNFDLEASFNGNKVYTYTTEHPSLGILKFKFPLKGDGTLRVRVRGNDETGLWTDWTDYFEITVKKASIIITSDFQTDKCIGSLTQNFETKDSLSNFVETQNQVTIDKPLGGTDTASVSGSNGKYSFTYNYVNGGIYTIRITSTNAKLGSSQLNSGQGQIVNILTGTSCEDGGCEGIGCYTNYLIVGAVIIAISFFVYFVFIRKK